MKVLAKLVKKSDVSCGTSNNGEWERQTLVFETLDGEGHFIPVEVFGKKKVRGVQPLQIGQLAEVIFRIDGREFEGRWFARLEYIHATPYVAASAAAPAPAATDYDVNDPANELPY